MSEYTQTDKFDVFVSHAGKDKELAKDICRTLENKGLVCWIAPRNVIAGNSYPEEILRGIEGSTALLLVLTENTQHSEFVLNEVERAKSYGKMIFTIRFEDVPLPKSMELILSSNHWVDAWEMDYPERLEQIVSGLKNKQSVSFEPINTSALTKLARVAKKNVISIAILVILLGMVAFFASMYSPVPMPDFYTELSEVQADDLSVSVKEAYAGSGKLYLQFQPVATELYGATELLTGQYQAHADFDNGVSLQQVVSLANIRFELPEMDSLPASVTLTLSDFTNDQSVSLTYDLPQLSAIISVGEETAITKAAQRLIQQLASANHHCFAVDGFVTRVQGCKFGSMGMAVKYSQLQKVMDYVAIGNNTSDLQHKLVLADKNKWSSGGFSLSLVQDNIDVIVPMYTDEMYLQIGFTDGTTSTVSQLRTTGMTQGNSVVLLAAEQRQAPDLLLSVSTNLNQAALVVPYINAATDVQYALYVGVNEAMQANGNMRSKTGLVLNDLMSIGTINLVVSIDGESTTYEYKNSIASAVADLDLDNAKKQVKSLLGCGQAQCSFGWLSTTQADIDRVADIWVGLSATELVSVEEGDLSLLNRAINSVRLEKLAAEKQRIANDTEQTSNLGFGTPVNLDRGIPLVERLTDEQVFKTSDDWRSIENKREAVIISYTFPLERLFFKVEWRDGTFSNVFVQEIN
ncbi:toll/interleukin-1 receptor domain-containing protein [Alteromonas sp. ASW11-36]|uniref:Toll/interleukin-1 receptor domain-containing protein n=1 Tax=Alteromonas arenosi TaxID=3055817 RepID=A0ABT7SXN9_9ALTE|nr:toll/interleukin-1 receptor domain-containing protein [Alteromonas sp. ASW11-36]MDM7860941.1 toll/interleukin-1 receptor domain-containing protein [Alteromonas sp. ASW11-36]